MSEAPPQTARSARLQMLDSALDRDPDAVEALAERAGLLREQGSFEGAKRDYLELIRRKPTDFAALNDFGTLVLNAGYREAARSLFGEAVRHHPANPSGHVNLANLLFLLGEPAQARQHFETALKLDPNHIHAHRGIAYLLAAIGDAAGARRHRDKGFKNHAVTVLPYRGDGTPVSVLLLVSALGGNIPTSAVLDDRYFQTTALATEYFDPASTLPRHDIVFNSIGDADLCREGLETASVVLSRTTRPVINHPARVLDTGRLSNVERLRGLQNVIVPRMVTLPRQSLMGPDVAGVIARLGFAFPFLVRAPGFHTGHHFAHVSTFEELAASAERFPGDDVWLIEQLDARGHDGLFRKYRAMFIDRALYPLHLAISRDWKVHYFTADMADSAENRAKDAAFLDDMTSVIGPNGMAGLERIRAVLGLDYGGIDFAVDPHGNILFFEANATMVVYPPSPDPKWAYRRPAVEAVLTAVRRMLTERSTAARAA